MSSNSRLIVLAGVLGCSLFNTAFAQSINPASDPNFESTHFSGSGNCSSCHDGLRDEKRNDVSIVAEWSGSMMANAARDPVFHAKFVSEVDRNPALAPVLAKKCLRCHAPMASVDADFDGQELTLFGDGGILDPANVYHDQAMDGVSCTVCHQIENTPDLGELSSFSGGFTIPTVDEVSQRVAYGQYTAPFVQLMRRVTGFEPTYSSHISDSALCGTCHNLKTPVVNSDGVVVSDITGHEFPEQAVYSEWEQSDFADDGATPQSCQDCHMQRADGVRMANRPRRLAPVNDFKRHGFAGANSVVLDILNNNRSELGVTADLGPAITSAQENLKSAAYLEIVSARLIADSLEVQVKVTNRTGHKLPTGYPSRRMWIDFQVLDDQGVQLFRSGRMREDHGNIDGVPWDRNTNEFEQHRQVIEHRNQVQIYESIMGNTDGKPTHTLLRADGYLKDNRIPPVGFDKTQVADDIAVIGAAFDDNDFGNGSDLVRYRVPVSTTGPLQINVALRYQPLSVGFLRDLFRDSHLPLVARLKNYWSQATIRAETMANVSLTVPQ